MDPQNTLSAEHGLIRQFLDNLGLAAEMLERGDRPSPVFFEHAVKFAREFADAYHHFKEEHVMFVLLAQKKQGKIDGQLEALRYQHERGRHFVSEMSQALAAYAANSPTGTERMLESTAAYVALLRHHIHREDHVFFPLAWKEFSPHDLEQIKREFAHQSSKHGDAALERNQQLVLDMGAMLVQ